MHNIYTYIYIWYMSCTHKRDKRKFVVKLHNVKVKARVSLGKCDFSQKPFAAGGKIFAINEVKIQKKQLGTMYVSCI